MRRTIYINAKTEADARAIAVRMPEAGYGDLREAGLDCRLANSINPAGALPFRTFAVEVDASPAPKVERVTLPEALACIILMFGGIGVVPVAIWMLGGAS